MLPFDLLKAKFDAIYILTLSSRKDRTYNIIQQLKSIGLTDINDIHIIYATPFPYNNIICQAFNQTKRGRFSKANEYDCARNHYSIIRQSYDLGYKNILVLEDDILFLNNLDVLTEYINNIPDDYDILQFGGFSADVRLKTLYKNWNTYWNEHDTIGIWNCSMYALSKIGMQYYLKYMDKFFWVADGPIYHAPANNAISYISKIPLVIQADKNLVKSDIRNEQNDTIDYNNDNVYEQMSGLTKDNYNQYFTNY